MDGERLRKQARAWRCRAERESGEDRARSLELAQSYDNLALSSENRDGAQPLCPPAD